MTLILASTSSTRIALLRNAGIPFEAVSPGVDERALELPLLAAGATPTEIALALARAKAQAITTPGALVLGGDQVLDLDGERFVKPADRADAARQIARLAGKTHRLRTAVVLASEGDIVWEFVSTASLTMRPLSEAAIERYLDEAGESALWSVGAYLLEGVGIQLFSAIDGDYFSILGLPLLPLLEILRQRGILPS
ncbi:Maf family protein [Kaistia terrae]|uniref:Nucleoside triphosphate pyrophosphatase n=1 Tax=Kaistia terrae TaxID=537017 RepID=A0ABW0PY36_9HYPH|nr:Maf family protein [Kaistia terrae]MCX5581394.1 Maf family protein [Kaistia terrae]